MLFTKSKRRLRPRFGGQTFHNRDLAYGRAARFVMPLNANLPSLRYVFGWRISSELGSRSSHWKCIFRKSQPLPLRVSIAEKRRGRSDPLKCTIPMLSTQATSPDEQMMESSTAKRKSPQPCQSALMNSAVAE